MTNYVFAPSPAVGRGEHPFTTWEGAFSDEELQRLVALGDALAQEKALLGGGVDDPDYRRSKVGWLHMTPDAAWVFDRLAYIVRHLNGKFYGYDLYGFCEGFQYTIYEDGDQGHYDWHQDWGSNSDSPRKLSLVVQLSDPADYEGGDLELLSSRHVTTVDKKKALATVFPSFMLHRVTPVTKGVRRTLVAWITGPGFR